MRVWSLGWEIPWRRKWLPTPVFLPGEFHGQKNLVGYSPWGHTESDTIEWRTLSLRIWKIQQCWCLNLLKSKLDAEKHHLKCYINFHHIHIIQRYFPLIRIFSLCIMGNNEMSWKRSSRETFPIYLSALQKFKFLCNQKYVLQFLTLVSCFKRPTHIFDYSTLFFPFMYVYVYTYTCICTVNIYMYIQVLPFEK